MGKKKIFTAIFIMGIAVLAVYQWFIKENNHEHILAEVKRSDVIQEVSETGQIQMGDSIKLGFKNAGTVAAILVKIGDEVPSGGSLIKLDTGELTIELNEARANLAIAQAKLNQLLAGSSAEEIQLAETILANARQNLADVQADAQEDLDQAHDDALNTLDGSYAKGSAALTTVTSVQRTYFYGTDQESIIVKEKKGEIEESLVKAKNYIDIAKINSSQTDIDTALKELKDSLSAIYSAIGIIRDTTEVVNYRDVVSTTNKTSLDTEKTNISAALTNITNAQQTITSTRLTNEKNINDASGKVKKAQDELVIEKAEPRQSDIDLYQAQVDQAQTKVDLLNNQIWEATLRSPVRARVAAVNKEIGEVVQPSLTESVATLLPISPYRVKVDIYEEDIVKMAVGNPVDISLVALPKKIFLGRVESINPAEKLIEGVVYYEATIAFEEETPQTIKPGMTADVVIKTALRENVLAIPEEGIIKKEGKNIVQVLKGDRIEEKEIEIGLTGSDDMVEVINGLSENEEIILR